MAGSCEPLTLTMASITIIIRAQSSLAAMQTLAVAAASLCKARVLLYATWGYLQGDPSNRAIYPDFATMHARTTRGYLAYAANVQQLDVNVTIGPAGTTMLLANTRQLSPEAKAAKISMATLLQDEKHPTSLGAFAAALTLANAILGTCLVGGKYTVGGVTVAQAQLLQDWACEAWTLQRALL